jgi:hypothetical protein
LDREELIALVDQKVAVRLKNVEAGGVEIIATLDEVRADGIVLREVGELGPGPTVFCPWRSLHRIRERPPFLRPPHEELEDGSEEGHVEIREAPVGEAGPRPPVERRREPSARTLERVVPVAQGRSVGDVTVALTSLELYGAGVGVLRWRVSLGEEALRGEPDFGFGIPEPVFEIQDSTGRLLPWSPRGGGASDRESDGEIEVWELPEAGHLWIEVVRLAADAYGPDGDHLGEGPSLDGPWSFRFAF